jgi:hypothetical protein
MTTPLTTILTVTVQLVMFRVQDPAPQPEGPALQMQGA